MLIFRRTNIHKYDFKMMSSLNLSIIAFSSEFVTNITYLIIFCLNIYRLLIIENGKHNLQIRYADDFFAEVHHFLQNAR
jgi:hypothetical protein